MELNKLHSELMRATDPKRMTKEMRRLARQRHRPLCLEKPLGSTRFTFASSAAVRAELEE